MNAETQFADFVAQRQVQLVRLGWALTGDRQLGEDLAQAALERLWPRWRRLSASGEPIAYAQRVVVTLAASWRRRPSWGELPFAVPPTDSADLAPDVEIEQRVRGWLAQLTPGQRAAIVLRFLLDLSVEQTAERLGCSTGTVKSQTSKALARLRALDDVSEFEG